jgi:hypothetical protein
MQWPLPFQSHGSFSQREQLFFVTDQTPRPGNFLLISDTNPHERQCQRNKILANFGYRKRLLNLNFQPLFIQVQAAA